jgi:hypothetical protein
MSFFSFIREQEGGTGSACGEGGISRKGDEVGKSVGGWVWCKYCVLYVSRKMRPVETIPGMGEGR